MLSDLCGVRRSPAAPAGGAQSPSVGGRTAGLLQLFLLRILRMFPLLVSFSLSLAEILAPSVCLLCLMVSYQSEHETASDVRSSQLLSSCFCSLFTELQQLLCFCPVVGIFLTLSQLFISCLVKFSFLLSPFLCLLNGSLIFCLRFFIASLFFFFMFSLSCALIGGFVVFLLLCF